MQVKWIFQQSELTPEQRQAWDVLISNNQTSSASGTSSFALHGQLLTNEDERFYAFAYQHDKLIAALPLVIKSASRKLFSFRYLQVAVHDHLDYFIAAGQNPQNEQQLIETLCKETKQQIKNWDMFFSRRWFFQNKPGNSLTSQSYQRQAAYFNLSNSSQIEQVLPKKLHKNLRRFEKKILASGKSLALHCATEQPQLNKALEAFYQIEASGWKGKAGSAIAKSEKLTNFYNNCWQEFASHGNAIVYRLCLDSKPIAACIAYRHKKTIYLHKIAYNEELAQLSPGSVMVKCIIESMLKQQGLDYICFNTNPPWVKRWKPQIDNLYAIQWFNHTAKGLVLSLVVGLYYRLRRLKHRLKHSE